MCPPKLHMWFNPSLGSNSVYNSIQIFSNFLHLTPKFLKVTLNPLIYSLLRLNPINTFHPQPHQHLSPSIASHQSPSFSAINLLRPHKNKIKKPLTTSSSSTLSFPTFIYLPIIFLYPAFHLSIFYFSLQNIPPLFILSLIESKNTFLSFPLSLYVPTS